MKIGNTQINFINPPEQSKDKLKRLYDTCNKIFNDDKFFYSKDEVKELRKNKNNIWL